jgi:HEAT repeat protein
MASGTILGPALGAEALILTAMTLVLAASAAVRSLRSRRLAPRLAVARAAVAEHLGGRELSEAERDALAGLPMTARVRLLADARAVLHGGGRERLTGLAGELGVIAAAERLCRGRRWTRRLRGVRTLTLTGGGDDVIRGLLADRSREVRAAAATACGDRPGTETLERLLDLLSDPEPLVRLAAKNALLAMGPRAVAPLAARIPRARRRELEEALEVAVGLAEPRLANAVLPLASSESARVRALVAKLTAAVGGERAVATVERLLDDPDAHVRAAAVEGLGKLGHWPAAPALAAALRDPAWEVRRQAALALRALGGPGLVLLRRALADEDRYARDMARQVLDLPGAVSGPGRQLEMPA